MLSRDCPTFMWPAVMYTVCTRHPNVGQNLLHVNTPYINVALLYSGC